METLTLSPVSKPNQPEAIDPDRGLASARLDGQIVLIAVKRTLTANGNRTGRF